MSETVALPNSCPKCGVALPSAATAGLCPRCLMAEAMASTQADAEPSAAGKTLSPVELAPHFPQLEILECLGRGGMGVVYQARQKSLNRYVALKLLAPERVADAKFAQRFTNEAQALAALNHPSIVTIYDFGQAGGFYFLLMEFVDGVNLRQAMKAGRFTPEQALAVVPPVCEALQYAHEHGIVHRDIKPENLLLDKDGRVKIADFGIAKMLGAAGKHPPDSGAPTEKAAGKPPLQDEPTLASAAGTPQYMAPEQKEHRRTDHRADIYSLGVVLYELLTGELPADQLQPPSRKVQIDVRLDEIVLRALETKPELRYQTAAELRTQVETFTSSPRGSRGNEAPSQGTDQSLHTSAAKETAARFLKVGNSTLATPEQLATGSGQFFHYRTRGQLILDSQQLTHSRHGTNTVIPLAAIRDLSLDKLPRTVNPAGLDLISVTYEEGGRRKQLLLSPMVGWIASPWTYNAHVAEWFAAIREGIIAATGRAPGQTPAAQLKVPGSHNLLALMLFAPPLALGVFIVALARLSPGVINSGLGLLIVLLWSMMVIAVSVIFVRERRAKSASGSAGMRSPWLFVPGLLALAAVFLPAVLLLYRSAPSSGVTHFDCAPVGVSNNVVIVDVTTEVGRGNAELRAVLDGPPLPAATEAALADTFFPPFACTFIKPNPFAGNHPWRILTAGGRKTWRLGFVLPDAALARDAFASLRPIGPLPAVADRTFSGTLFEVTQTNGQPFRASLQVALPFTSADPDWVSVFGQSQRHESAVTLTWEVLASQSGLAYFSRAGSPILVLRPDPQTKLYGVSVGLELIKVGTNRVQFVRHIGGRDPIREELPGDFRELAEELLRTARFSAKATSGTRIELCRFQGKPFTVQVHVTDSPGTYRLQVAVAVVVGLVGLLIAGGALIVMVIVRKGRSVGKAVLVVFGLALLFVLIAIVALMGWRAMTSNRLQESAQIAVEANRIAASADGLAMLSPIVGEGIGTNVFRSVTTIMKPRHVGVWTVEVKTDQGWSQMPELDLWALAWDNSAPFPVVAQWNADSRTNGQVGFELTVEVNGQRLSSRPSRQDWLNDYSWWGTPRDRSYWVGPGEWNLNEANQIPIFEGVKRSDPNARATIRLNFSLFALPDGFVPTLQSNIVQTGQNWRSSLGLKQDIPFAAVPLSSLPATQPGRVTVPANVVVVNYTAPFFLIGIALATVAGFLIWRARRRPPGTVRSDLPPRFSRTAIVGACLAPFFFIKFVIMFFAYSAASGHDTGPSWWLMALDVTLIPLGATALFGTTILGWIAVSQIHRSAGKLYGLGLAVFDGVLFPLLALDGLIVWLSRSLARLLVDFYANPSVVGDPRIDPPFLTRLANDLAHQGVGATLLTIVTVLAILVVDLFIIRAVWRAVHGSPASSAAARPESTVNIFSKLGILAIVGMIMLVLFGAMLLVWTSSRQSRPLVTPSYTPVRFEKNVLILDFRAVVSRGPCEVEVNLGGTAWAGKSATVVLRSEDLAGDTEVITLDRAVSVRTLTTGINTWRAAFALPTEALAREAWENLQPLGPLEVRPDRKTGGELFEVKAPTGATYTARFLAGPIRPRPAIGDDSPRGAHIGGNDHSVLVTHDAAAMHYVFYYAGDFGSSSSGSHNARTHSWTDEGSLKLKNGRTFGYRRTKLYPDELTVNGAPYDLRKGRVFVLHDDGTLEQAGLFPSVDQARDPAVMAQLVERQQAEASPEDPSTAARILIYSATGIDHGWGHIQARLDPDHELVFFLGEEGSGWFHSLRFGEPGIYQCFVERSDSIPLENGGKGRGFVLRSGPAGDAALAKSIVNVAMEPGDPVPAGELVFRRGNDIHPTDNATRLTFADIHQPDGTLVPVSVRVRKGQPRDK